MEDALILNHVIIGLLVLDTVLLAIFALLRRRIPVPCTLLAYLVILLCIVDATSRGSWWPMGTAGVMVALLIVISRVNRIYDLLAIKRDHQEFIDKAYTDDIRVVHINREFDKESE